jgi:TFIIF-interacting CTD phosphatase-like protein
LLVFSNEKAKKPPGKQSASFSLVHTDPSLKVSEKLALEIGKKDLVNLVRNRKLVLLVDLDHTLIHTTNEPIDPNLPVYKYIIKSWPWLFDL